MAVKLAGSNFSTKYFRLQQEYRGKRWIRVTVCKVPVQHNGDVLAADLSAYGSVEEVPPLRATDGKAHGDYILNVCWRGFLRGCGYWMRNSWCIEADWSQQIARTIWFTQRSLLEAAAHVPIVTDMFNDWFAQGAIPSNVTKNVIKLLKKGGWHVWEDDRLITLLNRDNDFSSDLSKLFAAFH